MKIEYEDAYKGSGGWTWGEIVIHDSQIHLIHLSKHTRRDCYSSKRTSFSASFKGTSYPLTEEEYNRICTIVENHKMKDVSK